MICYGKRRRGSRSAMTLFDSRIRWWEVLVHNANLFAGAACVCLVFNVGIAAAAEDVTISKSATKNMTISGGVVRSTRKNDIMNVTDLEDALAGGSVPLTTGTVCSQ